jgi:hypothetical protein
VSKPPNVSDEEWRSLLAGAKADRERRAELERTGRRVRVEAHEDNCGGECRNVGPRTLVADMDTHDCCLHCNDAAAELLGAKR